MLEEKDWLVINSMTYKMAEEESNRELRNMIIQQIRFLIPYKLATFYLLKSEDGITYSPDDAEAYGVTKDELQKYASIDFNNDYTKGLFCSGKSSVFRESDIMTETARMETDYYKEIYQRTNTHYSITLSLSYTEIPLGMLTLFRETGEQDFSHRDVYILEAIKEHLAFHLARLTGKIRQTIPEGKNFHLSSKESEVLEYILTNHEIPEIADKMYISVNTLRKHINHIYEKTGVNNRIQLINLFRRGD